MHLLAIAAAAAKDPPLIDLDSTVFLQVGLFLLTAVVLTKFLFKPFLVVRAERDKGIDGAKDEARRMDEEAKAKIADYDAKLTKAKAGAQEERVKMRAEATVRDRDMTEAARVASQKALDGARAKIDQDAKTARTALEAKTQEIARAMAKRILGREVV